jgi:TusA-related sulfurtransferase
MKKMNCIGDMCPVPIIKIIKELPKLEEGKALEVVTDHSCVVQSIKDKFKDNKLEIEEVMNGVWEIRIYKV